MEKNLVKQHEVKRVLGTRDLMMNDLKSEILQNFMTIAEIDVKELYTDWNLEKETGVMIGVMDEEISEDLFKWLDDTSKKTFLEKINEASKKAEKVPECPEAYWLNDRTILVRRSGILVQIEKEFIKNGFIEELKLSKRPLEHQVLGEVHLAAVVKHSITDTFLDWNFETDEGYVVFILKPKEQ